MDDDDARDGGVTFEAHPIAPDEVVAGDLLGDHELEYRSFRDEEPQKGRRLIFAICAIALFMASIDGTIVAIALPKIEHGLHSGLNWTAWSITIYQLGQIIVMPLAGKVSDQFGRKKIFVISVALFVVSSLLCGLSTSVYMLIPFRLLQAAGGGAFMPAASGIVSDHFGRDRDRALGMFTSIFPIGGVVGPAIGGPIVAAWSWRAIFFVNVPIGIFLFFLAIRFLPRSKAQTDERIDVRGVVILSTTIVAGMTGMSLLGEKGAFFLSPKVIVPFMAAIVLGVAFVRHARTAEAPFIPLSLLRGSGFGIMHLMNFLLGTAVMGFGALVPLYAEERYHIGVSSAGTVLSARAVGMILVAAVATLLLRRTGYRLPMLVGFSLLAVSMVMLSIAPRGLSPYWWLSIFSLLSGLGMGVASPAANNATLQIAPESVGAISGLRGMFRQAGGIVYVSVTTSVLARSVSPGLMQAHIFLLQAAVIVIMMCLVFAVPDHHGSW